MLFEVVPFSHTEYYFPCSADHEQDRQPYPVDPSSAICDDHIYITYVVVVVVVFTLKTVLTSILYPSLSYSSRQRNEFPWSQANPK